MSDLRDVVGEHPETLLEMDRYLRSQLELIRSDPLTYGHPPHDGQKAILSSPVRRRIVVSANRWGKTETGMRDVLWCARGQHPYRKVKLSEQLWVGAPDYPSYLRFHKPAFDKWCPPEWIIGNFNTGEKWVDIRRVDGGKCRIFFLSYDMPRSKWQGAGVDGIWLDEEMPKDIVKECLARIVTTRGWILLTFTPVEGVGWWFDSIFDPATKGRNNWWAFQAALATRDEANEAEFEVGEPLVPHLTRDEIVEFASEYPDYDERMVRIFGEVRARTGLVYKNYSRDIHKVRRFVLPPDYEFWGSVDPGYHGFHVSLVAISPMNRIYWIDEVFSQGETTSARFVKMVEMVRRNRKDEEWQGRPPVIVFFVDTEDPQVVLELNVQAATFFEQEEQKGRVPVQLAFASLEQGLKARKAGFLRCQQTLAPDPRRKTPIVERVQPDGTKKREWLHARPKVGEPQVYFFDDLHTEWQGEDEYHRESRILWEIERYSWKKPAKDKTVQPDDGDEETAAGAHAMATFRYLIMGRLGPPEEQPDEKDDGLEDWERDVLADFEEIERRQGEALGLW